MEPSNLHNVESQKQPSDDKQNLGFQLGLGFQSIDSENEFDEARYEKRLSDEFKTLVLGENQSEEANSDDFETEGKKSYSEGLKKLVLGEKEGYNGNKTVTEGSNGENFETTRTDSKGLKDLIFGENRSWDDNENEEGFENELKGYNGNKSENLKDLILGENRSKNERWVDHVEVFEDEGYNGNNMYNTRTESENLKKLILGKNGEKWGHENEERKGYYGNNDEGYNGNYENRDEGFYNGGNDNKWVSDNEGFEKGFSGGYPIRPDAEDCQYYMRYGTCKYGATCKFNHPLKRRNQYPKAAKDDGGYSERTGQTECKYHMTPGGCKYGNGCKYSHSKTNSLSTPALDFNYSKPRTLSTPAAEFNFLGLPIRPGETECPYYMRNGSCKYGSSCRFNHPEPTGADSPSGYVNGVTVPSQASPHSWSSPRALNGSASVQPMGYSPTNGVPSPNPEWRNSYQSPAFRSNDRTLPTPPAFAPNNPATTNFYMQGRLPMLADDFPERPGEPECTYFIKTGDCKYRSTCKFHHPKDRAANSAQYALSDKGLPLRPGQEVCSYYTRYGLCKYGPSCRYDHPVHYSASGQNASPFFGRQPSKWDL